MYTQLLSDIEAMTWVDWAATIFSITYVVLSAANKPIGWLFGIVGCTLWAYASFAMYYLYLDGILQVIYVLMGVWGLYNWTKGGISGQPLVISRMDAWAHIFAIVVGGCLSLLLGYLFSFTAAAATYMDAFTSVFSVWATVLLVQRRLENWLYWIVVNIIYAYLYSSQGAVLFAFVMIVYVVMALFGWKRWKRLYLENV
ncbi:MAG: nicotinamide riboside transporter PnuC [Saprospiraceae bacterium]